jgi:hypothetical protein
MRIPPAVERLRPFVMSWFVPLLLLAICLGLNIRQARALDMHRIAPLWVVDAVPVALASMEFGHADDYTGSIQVLGLFRDALKRHPNWSLNQRIKYALDHRDAVHEHLTTLAGYDDKGIIDHIKLSFRLFGYKLGSAIDLYFLILGISSLMFLVRFRTERWALLLLFGFLLAHYCLLPAVALNPHLQSVLALRFMSVLSMVAALHLALDVVLPRPGRWAWLLTLGQALILTYTLHIRFAAVWQVICVGAVFCLAWAWRLAAPRLTGARPEIRPALLPVILVVLGVLGLGEYKRQFYNPDYFKAGIDAHVFWHSVYSGLAYSPELAEEYEIKIDDVSIFWATRRFLLEHGREDEWHALRGSNGLYEQAVRSMFFCTLRERFGAVVRAVVWDKPRAMLHYVAWFMRLTEESPSPEVLWKGGGAQMRLMATRMDEEGKFFQPFRVECVLALALFVAWAWRGVGPRWKLWTAAFAVFVACSAMPSVLGYPTAHTVGDMVIAAGMALQVGAAATLAALLRVVQRDLSIRARAAARQLDASAMAAAPSR